jgi:hypothetical protein
MHSYLMNFFKNENQVFFSFSFLNNFLTHFPKKLSSPTSKEENKFFSKNLKYEIWDLKWI